LATAQPWLAWLRTFSAPLYEELIKHMRDKPGCKHNREKMLDILKKISLTPGGTVKLEQFLRQSFPNVLKDDPGNLPVRDLIGEVPVFGHYDPSLMTIPRRIILVNKDQAALLNLIQKFMVDKAEGDYVVVGSRAYVEYLPQDLEYLKTQIPAQNWLTRKWKNEHRGE
jgi:hypothetical protein